MKNNKRKTKTVSIIRSIKTKLRALSGKTAGKQTGIYPRKLARSVAKANMKRSGMSNINRNFSYNWRNWVR